MANEKVDVVIVGAGASGSVFAAVLAKAGKTVVVMEQGPDWQSGDLISSEIWGRRIRPAGSPFLLEGKNPFGFAAQAGWGVGGAALHYFANHPRYLPTDFKIKSEHNRAHDWPISYDDVAPFYDRVAQDVGMSGDAKSEEIWRPAGRPYPMPPMKTFRHGEIWLKGFESIGVRMVPAPVAMNSTEFKGRPACIYDGWCHVGCPTGALGNPVVTYLSEARQAKAEVRAMCTVTRVLTNPQGTRAIGVEYYDDKKQRQVQEASVVVLAAWSGQNPRILLNSSTDKHAKGLANANGLVGKYMMTHTIGSISAIFDEDLQNHLGTIGAQYMSYDRYPKTSYKNAFGSTYITVGAAQKTHDFLGSRPDLFGPDLHAFVKRAARGFTRISMFGEELPDPENRIELVSDKDQLGMPLARLVHGFNDDAVAVWRANVEEGQKAAKAAGAKEVRSGQVIPTTHLHGGTIMGTGAANSVVNSFGQTHEVPNLDLAGPSTFPTEGASNPTYTLLAVALRGAEQLASKWGSVAG
ncbi:MAG: GMC family oxidoreductase [Hyphomicrobiales bacterium]|nr:GMC family oxidoreductase [Hyphomicrobiales bacterium]